MGLIYYFCRGFTESQSYKEFSALRMVPHEVLSTTSF